MGGKVSEQEGRYGFRPVVDVIAYSPTAGESMVTPIVVMNDLSRPSRERAALLALAAQLERPMAGMGNAEVAKRIREIVGGAE